MRGLYLPNAWSLTLQNSKRHTASLGFPSVPLVWGKTVSCRLCAGQSKGTLKTQKMLFLIWLHPRYKIQEFFTIAPVLTSEIAAIRHLYIGLRVCYKYYRKKIVILVWPGLEPPMRQSWSKSPHKCITYNNRYVQNFIQNG